VGEEREEAPKEEVEEVKETPKEIKKESRKREDVEFIPTDEEAKKTLW